MVQQDCTRLITNIFTPLNKRRCSGIWIALTIFFSSAGLILSEDIVKNKTLIEQTTAIFSQEYNLIQNNQNMVGYLKIKLYRTFSDDMPYRTEIESYTKIPLLFFEKETVNHETEYFDKDFQLIYSSAETVSKDVTTWTICERRNNKIYISTKNTKGKKKSGNVPIKPAGYTPMGMRYYMLTDNRFKQKNNYQTFSLDKKTFKWHDCKISVDELQDVIIDNKKQKLYPIQVRIIMQGVFLILYINDEGNIVSGNFLGIDVVPSK